MSNTNIINKLICNYQQFTTFVKERKDEKEANKHRYKIEDLYVGKIISIETEHPSSNCDNQAYAEQLENIVKDFAILYHPQNNTYLSKEYFHLYTQKIIFTRDISFNIKKYGVDNVEPFTDVMHNFMREAGLTEESVLSLRQIRDLEDMLNRVCKNTLKPNDLCWN